jgi:hypothetical protein
MCDTEGPVHMKGIDRYAAQLKEIETKEDA